MIIHRHKHLWLLIVTIVALSVQPLTQRLSFSAVTYELLAYTVLMASFLALFERRNERRLALVIGLPVMAANVVSLAAEGETQRIAAIVFHALSVLFLGYAVGIILRGIFNSRRIGHEQLWGACSGYLLAGVAWGNLYVMLQLIRPDSFDISPDLVWQLDSPDSRRFLMNYFSFITLATVGYGDVSPRAPAACTLAWLEAMFGQFYMAVFVGQLIGLKLAQRPPEVTD